MPRAAFNEPPGWGARWAKLSVDQWTPAAWDAFLYLDADTVMLGDPTVGFSFLDDGWDLVIAPSQYQGVEFLRNGEPAERDLTLEALGAVAVAMQGGAFFAHRQRCRRFFQLWRQEWRRRERIDQGALLRALWRAAQEGQAVKVWPLPLAWHRRGGSVIDHRFGNAK